MFARSLWVCLSLWFWLVAGVAHAQVPTPINKLTLNVNPILGIDTPAVPGWVTYVAVVTNPGKEAINGTLRLAPDLGIGLFNQAIYTQAPVSVGPGDTVVLKLPVHDAPPLVFAQVHDDADTLIAQAKAGGLSALEPLLFDLSSPSRIASYIRGRVLTTQYSPSGSIYAAEPTTRLAVSAAQTDEASGAPLLPHRAAGYASATLVLLTSEQLASLQGPELSALTTWVLGGGSVALVITRPEDLRHENVSRLVGGELRPQPYKKRAQLRAWLPDDEVEGLEQGRKRNGFTEVIVTAKDSVQQRVVSFSGGNLQRTLFGQTATYGLGEVHVLPIDLSEPVVAEDPWAQLLVRKMVTHAWDRRAQLALPHANLSLEDVRVREARSYLDPNVGNTWTVVLAGLVLLIYSVLAGPVNFYLAKRRGNPLAAFWRLPLWSLGALVIVIGIGVLAKGGQGTARHLSLIEAGAGMPLGSTVRFRAFFASSTNLLTVEATERSAVLDVTDAADTPRTLVIERDGARLEDFQTKPWQTLMVREDSFSTIGGGVSIQKRNGEIHVKNATARDLLGVVVGLPGGELRYFARIADGATVRAKDGELSRASTNPKTRAPVDLSLSSFRANLDRDVKGLGEAWAVITRITDRDVDWWPQDVPSVVGQLGGGEGILEDAGLPVDRDRALLRVIGYGGSL